MRNNRPLVSLAAILTAAACHAQMPKVEMALFADQQNSVVYRLDLQTGRYFGSFGAGKLMNPQVIAVDSKIGVAYVGDRAGIKKFDVSTGKYLGLVVGTSNDGKNYIYAAAVEPDGSVDAIASDFGMNGYVVRRFNPTTGVKLAESPIMPWLQLIQPSLTIAPNGTVEAWVRRGNDVIVDQFPKNLQSVVSFTSPTFAVEALHAKSGDTFFAAGFGKLYAGTGLGTEIQMTDSPYSLRGIGEGANGVVYATYSENNGTYTIEAYDTLHG